MSIIIITSSCHEIDVIYDVQRALIILKTCNVITSISSHYLHLTPIILINAIDFLLVQRTTYYSTVL